MSSSFYLVKICQIRLTVISQNRSNQHEVNELEQINLSSLCEFDAESCKLLPTDSLVSAIVNSQHHIDGVIDGSINAYFFS